MMGGGIFKEKERKTVFGPRAATVDAQADRQNLLQKSEAIRRNAAMAGRIRSIPGLIDMVPPGAGDNEVYVRGLQSYLAGDFQGAVDSWASVPHHTEARRGLQRLYQQIQRQQGGTQ